MTNTKKSTLTGKSNKIKRFTALILSAVMLLSGFAFADGNPNEDAFAYPADFKAVSSEPFSSEYSVEKMLSGESFYASKDDETEKWIMLEILDAELLPDAVMITPRLYGDTVVSDRINGAELYGSDESILKDQKPDLSKAEKLTTVSGITDHKEYTFDFDLKGKTYKYYMLYFNKADKNNKISLNLESLKLHINKNFSEIFFYSNTADNDVTAISKYAYEKQTVSAKNIMPAQKKGNSNFKGWYTEKSGGEKVEEFVMGNKIVKLYAQWEPISAVKPEIKSISEDITVVKGYMVSPRINVNAETTDGQTLTYQWYCNSEKTNVDGSKIENATDSVYEFPLLQNEGEYYFYCVVTATTENGLTAKKTTSVVTVSVKNQMFLKIPALSGTYVYNKEAQTAKLENFNEELMTVKNNVQTEPNTYEIVVELKDKELTKWEDGTTESKNIEWKISKATLSAPKVSVTQPTVAGGKGKVSDISEEMEYASWGNDTYQPITSNEIELEAGVYKFRYKKSIYNEVSSYTIVTINEPDTHELTGNIHGSVGDFVTISLKKGSTEVKKVVVTGDRYAINNIPSDEYNMVVKSGAVTITKLIKIHDSITADITVENISSIVESSEESKIVVGNIDIEAKEISSKNENAPVELKFKAEKISSDSAINDAAAKNNQIASMFFNFGMSCSINNGESTDYTLSENLLEIIIPISSDSQKKENYKIYRKYNDQTDILTEKANADGEYMVVNDDCTQITLYVKKFSAYAVAYDKKVTATSGIGQGLTKFTVTFDTMGGSKIDSVKVKRYTPVSQPKNPVRNGYTFKGWYTDKNCTVKYSFSSNVTKSMTLYAGWRSNSDSREIIMKIDSKTPTVNGKTVKIDVPVKIINDRTLTPARFIAENLGADVSWNEDLRLVTITLDDVTIELIIDSSTAYVNGKAVKLDSPAVIYNDRTLTPSRFVAENLGANVSWDDDGRVVTITKD